MSACYDVSVFIPCEVFNAIYVSYVFGYVQTFEHHALINLSLFLEANNNSKDSIRSLLSSFNKNVNSTQNVRLLGVIYDSEKSLDLDLKDVIFHDVIFVLRVDKISFTFHFDKIAINHDRENVIGQVILYDANSFVKSQLLLNLTTESADINANDGFISFILLSCKNTLNCLENVEVQKHLTDINVCSFPYNKDKNKILELLKSVCCLVAIGIFHIFAFSSSLFFWWPNHFSKVICLTAVGRQLHQRVLHCTDINMLLKSGKSLSLKQKNLISAVLLDIIFGCLLMAVLLQSNLSLLLFETAVEKTTEVVNKLQILINWLMGFPAGLKLNAPLNSALGQFFLYHIYLWESYIVVVQPVFGTFMQVSSVIGTCGVSFVLCLFNDMISLATIHIYCFYGYAARLYGYQMQSLSSLWRLFRGKKWNPLRKRVDSYTYDVHQLYLGTLIFTVLLFLLPTVMVYYFVFTCLRLTVLILQGIISRITAFVTIFPFYSIVSRLLCSSETTGDVYISVFDDQSALVLNMQASQVSFSTVIQKTLPELNNYREVLHWKDLFSSIIWGKIIYPL